MKITGLDQAQIRLAAERARVRLNPWSKGVCIRTLGPGKQTPWTKVGCTGRTIPGAVCWHGHRQFMRECFKLNPEAVIKSCLATYKGSEHFEQTHRDTYPGTWSSHFAPEYSRGEQCRCFEDVHYD